VRALSDALAKDPSNEDARWNLEVLLRKRAPPPESSADGGKASRDGSAGSPAHPSPSPPPPREEKAAPGQREEEKARREGGEKEEKPGDAQRAEAERRPAADAGPRREPLSRQEAEALLDALRARERNMPVFGRERRERARARSQDAAKDW
jgi:hypothetical protein